MSSMTFGQLVESQMDSQQSLELAIASDYKIAFGKHKGMTLSLLMEQQTGYCNWLLKQETSKNENFNLTVNYLKLLIAADQEMEAAADEAMGGVVVNGVPLVEGEPVLLAVDPAKKHEGIPEFINVDPAKKDEIPNGLLMGTVTDLLEQVSQGDLSFEFGKEDIDTWFELVKDNEAGIENFVIIETMQSDMHNSQRIKKVIHSMNNLKEMKGVLNA